MPEIYYIDNSTILDIYERSELYKNLPQFLNNKQAYLGLSEENFYELTSRRLDARTKTLRRRTVRALLAEEMPILFFEKRGLLAKAELLKLRISEPAAVNPFISIKKEQIIKDALDSMSTKYMEVVKGNPKVILPSNRDILINQSRKWFSRLREMNKESDIANFNLQEALDEPDLDLFNAAHNQGDVSAAALEVFTRYRAMFRTLDAMYRAQCYFISRIPHSKRSVPRGDVVTDVMHLVEAAYADVLITADDTQAREAAIIVPHIRVMHTRDIQI